MPHLDIVQLSRIQFGLTAMYHFLFVPLTLGLSILIAMMESVYVMTGRAIWREMTKFWGLLFGINFAMGVATGITMEFQFGTNWSYYAHYVGDIFGAPLAIEGMMAFFLEATFVGLFFFGWDKLSKLGHLAVTWLLAIGTNLSALWILIANGWMQHPKGAFFNVETMRMELSSFYELLFNPVAQTKFVHTVSAGYVTGAMFVLSISAFYALRGQHLALAKRSMTIAATFGLASALSVVVLGDESGYIANTNQKMKIAAIEAMWDTEPAPASFTLFGLPDQQSHETKYAIKVPYLLGIIATRSLDRKVEGINDLIEVSKKEIKQGQIAYQAVETLRKDPNNPDAKRAMQLNQRHLGDALLLKRYTDDVVNATPEMIDKAARDTVPQVAPLFFGFRIMVACGMFFILLFALGFYFSAKHDITRRWFLWMALLSLPLPWVASEVGWFVAEYGRQPWVIEGILPTFLGVSSITHSQIWLSLMGFVVFYTLLAVVEVFLMVKYIKKGPSLEEQHNAN